LEETELDKYQEEAKDKLKQLKKVWHDERRAKEAALREQQEAVRVAKRFMDENKTLKERLSNGETAYVDTVKQATAREMDMAKAEFKSAYESGDADKLLEAQEKMTAASLRMDKAQNYQHVYQKALQEEQIAQQKAIQERAIQGKNLEEVAAQKQELEDRQAAQAGVQKERIASIASIGLTGLGAIDEEIEKIKTIRGAKPDPKTLEALSKQTGLSAEELGRTLEFFASAPPQASQILKDILAGGTTGAVSTFGGSGTYSQGGLK
jgi:hypothetical protein